LRISILQSNYVPWVGFFHLIASSDAVVVLDSVQFTKNDWRNRNRIVGPNGPFWLTIPIRRPAKLSTPIDQITVAGHEWSQNHLKSIVASLKKRPYWKQHEASILTAYESVGKMGLLTDINVTFMRTLMKQMSIETPLVSDRSLGSLPIDPNSRLITLCHRLGANTYLTGPAGMNYLKLRDFQRHGLNIQIFQYSAYGPYEQTCSNFTREVSVLDFLANNSPNVVRQTLKQVHIDDMRQTIMIPRQG
jgi:hypothetical protein